MKKNTVILQDQQSDKPCWLEFSNPITVIAVAHTDEVLAAMESIQSYVDEGYYAAGYLGYEAAAGLNAKLKVQRSDTLPLLWFGIYTKPIHFAFNAQDYLPASNFNDTWQTSVNWTEYKLCLDAIKQRICDGDTYQVNYSFRLHSQFQDDPWQFFVRLHAAQQAKYSAYLDLGRFKICSVSPELFISLNAELLKSLPMKGTIARGFSSQQDAERAKWLAESEKNRAENVMIVDMIRNDMSAIPGTSNINASPLFTIEKYPTVHQMVSLVSAQTTAKPTEIIKQMFPCASITGAPKVKTMEIICELENSPRGIYTGSIGYISPKDTMQFNVAIRTAVIDSEAQQVNYGVGGGITWESDTRAEYEECLAKASVLTRYTPECELIETVLWKTDTGFYLLAEHLDRLSHSADYFGFDYNEAAIKQGLAKLIKNTPDCNQKVRILLNRYGQVRLETNNLNDLNGLKVGLSSNPIKTDTPFVFHKTSNRAIYRQALEHHPDCGDVILFNERDEITESTFANIVIKEKGQLLTPAVHCGLLDGVLRSKLIKTHVLQEAVISKSRLLGAEAIYLVNSVRGWMALTKSDKAWTIETVSATAPPYNPTTK